MIVAKIDAAIGERWVGPHNFSSADAVRWIDQMSSADLVDSLGTHFCNDQVTDVVGKKVPVSVANREDVTPG